MPRPPRSTLFPYTTLFRSYERSSSRLSRWYLYFFVFIFIVYYLFTGQRDFLVRSVMLVLFLIYLREKLSIKTIWLRSEEHTSELQSRENLVCRLLLEKKKQI